MHGQLWFAPKASFENPLQFRRLRRRQFAGRGDIGGDFAIGRTDPYVLKNAPCAVWVVREPIVEEQQ